jgi:hypothetical protein
MWQVWGRVRLDGVLVGKPVRKISIGRPSITWKDIIKTDLKRLDGALTGLLLHRTGTSGGAVVIMAINFRIP